MKIQSTMISYAFLLAFACSICPTLRVNAQSPATPNSELLGLWVDSWDGAKVAIKRRSGQLRAELVHEKKPHSWKSANITVSFNTAQMTFFTDRAGTCPDERAGTISATIRRVGQTTVLEFTNGFRWTKMHSRWSGRWRDDWDGGTIRIVRLREQIQAVLNTENRPHSWRSADFTTVAADKAMVRFFVDTRFRQRDPKAGVLTATLKLRGTDTVIEFSNGYTWTYLGN